MNPLSLPALGSLFTVAGFVLGLPSIGVLLLFAASRIAGWFATKQANPRGPVQADGLLLFFQTGVDALDAVAGWFLSLAQFILNGLAIVAGVSLMFALLFWLTGRGLQAEAGWAKVLAALMLTAVALLSLLIALSVHDSARWLMVGLAVFCLLGLAALWNSVRAAAL